MIVELAWEDNDEYMSPHGEWTQDRLYYDRDEAEAECRRLCAAFFAAQTPVEFEADIEGYLPSRRDKQTVTWAELCAAGFPNPYYVCQFHAATSAGT